MDATANSPMLPHVLDWLSRLCSQTPSSSGGQGVLRVGDVIFTGRNKLIQRATKSPWSHAALYLGGGIVAEATPGNGNKVQVMRRFLNGTGVRTAPAASLLLKPSFAVLRHPDSSLFSEEKFEAYSALGWHMVPYSPVSAVRSLLATKGWLKPKPVGVFCSQFVLQVYQTLGIGSQADNDVNPYTITPDGLYKHLMNDLNFQEIIKLSM